MRIHLLARRKNAYTTRRFVKAAREMGHAMTILDPLKCTLLLSAAGPQIFYDSARLEPPQVLLGRVSSETWSYGLAVVEQFEMMNVPVVNRSVSIAKALDSVRSLQLLAEAGVPVVGSVMVRSPRRLKEAVEMAGGTPLVMKLLKGNFEIGSILSDSFAAAESTLETLWELGQNILLQRWISGREKGDIRAFVVGGKVLAAVRRPPVAGVFRADIHRRTGGNRVEMSAELERLAVEAVRVMGLGVAGVDMLEGEDGYVVLGVHASPGFKWIERLSGIDAARSVLEFAQSVAKTRGREARAEG